jgi:hypothetical protein
MAEIGGYCEPRHDAPYVCLREHACPGCGTLLLVDVVVAEEAASGADSATEAAVAG